MKDGGPAFPSIETIQGRGWPLHHHGLSMRDYFAVHADQPGISEIAAFAGMASDGFYVWKGEGEKVKFNLWWETIPLEERCALSAGVRYAMADALIAAREPKAEEPTRLEAGIISDLESATLDYEAVRRAQATYLDEKSSFRAVSKRKLPDWVELSQEDRTARITKEQIAMLKEQE